MASTQVPEPSSSARSALPSIAEEAGSLGAAHEAEGRLMEAVAVYERAQAIEPSLELAHRIVRVRHDAVAQQELGTGPSSWPVAVPDPFPDTCGAPEIDRGGLTGASLGGAILHHGCLIVRGLVDPGAAADLSRSAGEALEEWDRAADGASPAEARWYQPFEPHRRRLDRERAWVRQGGGMLTADAPALLCAALDAFHEAGALAAIGEHLREPVLLSLEKTVVRRVFETVPTWHQDGAFMGAEVRSVDLWLALTECGEGASAPGLDIVPKRFADLLDTQTHGAVFPSSIGDGLVDLVAADAPWVTPHFAPGDAILFDERFVHRSAGAAGMTTQRLALESWFFAASHFPAGYLSLAV